MFGVVLVGAEQEALDCTSGWNPTPKKSRGKDTCVVRYQQIVSIEEPGKLVNVRMVQMT